jgi:hypothetical protein
MRNDFLINSRFLFLVNKENVYTFVLWALLSEITINLHFGIKPCRKKITTFIKYNSSYCACCQHPFRLYCILLLAVGI